MNLLAYVIPKAFAQAPAGLCLGADCKEKCDFSRGLLHFDCIPAYISDLTFVIIGFSASLSLVLLVVNGYRYMLGPVSEGSSDSAKKGILYALVGLAVSLMAYIILDTIIVAVTG